MNYSIVPPRGKKDPRQLLYHYPSLPAQKYAKLVASFHHHQMLSLAEQISQKLDFLLIPAGCLHRKTKVKFAGKKVQIGKEVYYMMKEEEIPRRSAEKYRDYIQEIQLNKGIERC